MNNTIGRERGWPPYSRMRFQHDVGPEGALYVGSPETVARKIADTVRTLGIQRFDMKFSTGTLSHEKMMRSIELYGTQRRAAGAGTARPMQPPRRASGIRTMAV